MSKIQEWVYNLLVQMGLISENSSYLDNIVILLLIIAVTVGIDYSCRYIFLGMFKRLARKTKNQLDDLIVDRKIINKMMHMIPAILIYILLPFAFSAEETPKILIDPPKTLSDLYHSGFFKVYKRFLKSDPRDL